MPRSEVFLDVAYAMALAGPDDHYHARAVALAEQLEAEGTRLVTTRAVVLEIGQVLNTPRHHQAGFVILETLEHDRQVEILPVSDQVYARALRRYRNQSEVVWSLTDCISFVVMQDRNITEALTTNVHFRQAGFRILLGEEAPEAVPTGLETPVYPSLNWLIAIGTLAGIGCFLGFLMYHALIPTLSTKSWLLGVIERQYAATVGVPLAAIMALGIVFVFNVVYTEPLELHVLGLTCRGAAAMMVLWLCCFAALVVACYVLWVRGAVMP